MQQQLAAAKPLLLQQQAQPAQAQPRVQVRSLLSAPQSQSSGVAGGTGSSRLRRFTSCQ
jgi:hypothetical protein